MKLERYTRHINALITMLLISTLCPHASAVTKSGTQRKSALIKPDYKFRLAHNSPHMLVLGAPIKGMKSRLACGLRCSQKEPKCFSFAYDSNSLICTLGTWIFYDKNKPSNVVRSSSTTVHTNACCPKTNPSQAHQSFGYELQILKNELSRCVGMNHETKNFDDSRDFCENHNGKMLTTKTKESYELFWKKAHGDQTWLGLRVDEQAGTDKDRVYRWEDGTYLTEEVKEKVLGCPIFDNHNGNERCIHIWAEKGWLGNSKGLKLNDIRCQNTYKFICEHNVPIENKTTLHNLCREMRKDYYTG